MEGTAELDEVLICLQENRVRATYGAVAQVVGSTAFHLMQGEPRDPLHSWVVNKRAGDPTKYREDQKHPELYDNKRVIRSPDEVRELLSSFQDSDGGT